MKSSVEYFFAFFSKLFNPNGLHVCRFVPSCSVYAREVWRTHSAPEAMRLIAVRLWRCRPFGGWGYDPAPERIKH